MHFDSPSDLRRWSDAFSWILPDPQAKVAKLVAEEQAKKQVTCDQRITSHICITQFCSC
jgi:hypothetical protein